MLRILSQALRTGLATEPDLARDAITQVGHRRRRLCLQRWRIC